MARISRPKPVAGSVTYAWAQTSQMVALTGSVAPIGGDPIRVYDPTHPDADAQGYVSYPDVDAATQMTDLMGASRSYSMNATVTQVAKQSALDAIEIRGEGVRQERLGKRALRRPGGQAGRDRGGALEGRAPDLPRLSRSEQPVLLGEHAALLHELLFAPRKLLLITSFWRSISRSGTPLRPPVAAGVQRP